MVIREITLTNFRSHERFSVRFDTHTTTITGENGCGKTSILEAIYETMQGKSFKAVDREITRRGADFYRAELEYLDGRKVVALYDGTHKEFLVEDKKTRRLPKKAKYPIVLFEPDDLHLVGSSPTSKRSFFDKIFSGISEQYGTVLSRYNKALKQRNELLKSEDVTPEQLFSWDVLIAKYGTAISEERAKVSKLINERFTDVYRSIAENRDTAKLKYMTDISGESEYLARLSRDFDRDSLLGHTTYGAHRDNYEFVFNDSDADGSASRGEVRSMVLALKFIEAEIVAEATRKKPVVLLDDVFSELDESRQKSLVTNFKDNQVILTSVANTPLTVSY